VKLGTKNAKGDYILVLDADGEYLISDIPRLLEFSLKNPISVIYGSRYLTGKTIKVRMLPISGQSILNLYFNYFLYKFHKCV
jgi:glycosyltransferase involved in cell wall biosynthesis